MVLPRLPVWLRPLSQWSNRHEWLLLLITFMIGLRLPSLFEPAWYGDETIYLAIGQDLRQGARLYVDVTDYPNKTPLIYWLAALSGDVANFRFLLLLWQIPAVIGFFLLSKKLFNSETAGFFATLAYVYLTATPLLEGTIANAEIFFLTPVIWAACLAYPGHKLTLRRSILVGLLLGLAFLFKLHVIFEIVFILLYLLFSRQAALKSQRSGHRLMNLLMLMSGVITPLILTFIWLWSRGLRFSNLVVDVFTTAAYTTSWGEYQWFSQILGLGSLWARIALFTLLVGCLFVLRHRLEPINLFTSLWLLCSLSAALLSGRPYPHYLLQIVPALILIITHALISSRKLTKVVALVGVSIVTLAYLRFEFAFWPVKAYYQNFLAYASGQIDQTEYFRHFDTRMPRNYQLAQRLRQLTSPSESIYIWGNESDVYVLSGRTQVGPFVTAFHVHDLNRYQETIAILEQTPPEIIVSFSNYQLYPKLHRLLQNNYVLIDQIDSTTTDAQATAHIYRRAKFLTDPPDGRR